MPRQVCELAATKPVCNGHCIPRTCTIILQASGSTIQQSTAGQAVLLRRSLHRRRPQLQLCRLAACCRPGLQVDELQAD